MKVKRSWKVSRVQTVEFVFATFLTCATWSDPAQPMLSKAGSLLQLEMIATSILRSKEQGKEGENDSEAARNH